jgi:hypothetical protein
VLFRPVGAAISIESFLDQLLDAFGDVARGALLHRMTPQHVGRFAGSPEHDEIGSDKRSMYNNDADALAAFKARVAARGGATPGSIVYYMRSIVPGRRIRAA